MNIESVNCHTRHLATNAFEVFAHGVRLDLADIRSDTPIEEIQDSLDTLRADAEVEDIPG